MGKDKNGKFIPPKGKPTGNGKEDNLGISQSLSPEEIEKNLDITDKYTNDSDSLAPSVHLRHANRNVHKKTTEQKNDADDTVPDKTVSDTFRPDHPAAKVEELPYLLTKDNYEQLAAFRSDCCVTLYMPTHQWGKEINEKEDLIRCKNLLQEAHLQLKEKGMPETAIRELLQPGFELVRDEAFWQTQRSSLALFFSKGQMQYIRLPLAAEEKLYINNHFWLLPLAPLWNAGNNNFYLLVFSKHHAQLYQGDEYGMQPVEIPDMPRGMADVVHYEEKGNEQLFRTGSSAAGRGANYHGMNSNPDHKTDIALYLEEVDKTLWKSVLSTSTTPLMLAAVDYLIPIYKSVSRYAYFTDETLTGNFEHTSPSLLFEQVKEKLSAYFNRGVQQAMNNYYNHSADALSASIPADIIPAAYYGQVAQLVVPKDMHLWGRFDAAANQLELHDTPQPGDECLVNDVVAQTLLHNGEVWVTDRSQLPEGASMAAVLRYA